MISRSNAIDAILNLQEFHNSLKIFYESHNMNFLEDLGRRNILMSRPQEKFFAKEINKKYPGTSADGRTGEPDILIPTLQKELECKITSPHKSGSWNLQTDYNTLKHKGKLDYLYVLCNREFTEFAVLHFIELTTEDFRPPASGSRGKSAIVLRKAIKKCRILVGDIKDRNIFYINKIKKELKTVDKNTKEYSVLEKRLKYWENTPKSFSFVLEKINLSSLKKTA